MQLGPALKLEVLPTGVYLTVNWTVWPNASGDQTRRFFSVQDTGSTVSVHAVRFMAQPASVWLPPLPFSCRTSGLANPPRFAARLNEMTPCPAVPVAPVAPVAPAGPALPTPGAPVAPAGPWVPTPVGPVAP